MRIRPAPIVTLLICLGILAAARLFAAEDRPLPLELTRPVHVSHLEEDAFVARWREVVRAGMSEEGRCRRIALHRLALITSIESRMAERGILGDRNIPRAFYVSGTDSIFVLEGESASVIRHEMVHALDDQTSDRISLLADPSLTTDEVAALRAAMEGLATAWAHVRLFPIRWSGNLDHNTLVLSYLHAAHLSRAGESISPAEAIAIVPPGTYALLFPGAADPHRSTWHSGGGEQDGEGARCSDVGGALAVFTALLSAGTERATAELATRDWIGDRITLNRSGDVHWSAAFASQWALDTWVSAVRRNTRGQSGVSVGGVVGETTP